MRATGDDMSSAILRRSLDRREKRVSLEKINVVRLRDDASRDEQLADGCEGATEDRPRECELRDLLLAQDRGALRFGEQASETRRQLRRQQAARAALEIRALALQTPVARLRLRSGRRAELSLRGKRPVERLHVVWRVRRPDEPPQ